MGRLPPGSVDNAHLIAVPARNRWSRKPVLSRETSFRTGSASTPVEAFSDGLVPRAEVQTPPDLWRGRASERRSGPLRRATRARLRSAHTPSSRRRDLTGWLPTARPHSPRRARSTVRTGCQASSPKAVTLSHMRVCALVGLRLDSRWTPAPRGQRPPCGAALRSNG